MAREWSRELITEERTAITVRDVWINSAKTIYAWGVEEKHIAFNPFAKVKVSVPDKIETRESKAFTDNELRIILKSASVVDDDTTFGAAKRWCPWIAAYTGARMGELTQLRAEDVLTVDGVPCIRITPEAGTVKTRKPRTVPLHGHLIKQGFLSFVKGRKGPLFYNPTQNASVENKSAPRRPRAVKQRERLAGWIRELGVTDEELSPTHGFRHSFKAIAARSGILEKYSDAITGHAHATVARRYGAPTVSDLAEALKAFPRYRT
jgi:integrase